MPQVPNPAWNRLGPWMLDSKLTITASLPQRTLGRRAEGNYNRDWGLYRERSVSESAERRPLLLTLYERYLDNQDTAAFERSLARHYAPGTLERLASHALREVRRAAVLGLGIIGDYTANHTLGCALLDADRMVRLLAETGLRSVWFRAGSESQRRRLGVGARLTEAHCYLDAIRQANELIDEASWLAEAWNQRALAYFSLARYSEAIRDCHQTLELNPYHFAAAAGMGQAYLQLRDPAAALESFRRALRLNPGLDGVRAQVVRLARRVEGNRPDGNR